MNTFFMIASLVFFIIGCMFSIVGEYERSNFFMFLAIFNLLLSEK
jgi:hypothetical protein